MAGPWEKYQSAAPANGPWSKYQGAAPAQPAQSGEQPIPKVTPPAAKEDQSANLALLTRGESNSGGGGGGWGDQVVDHRAMRIAAQGLGAGAADLAGLPADAVSMSLNMWPKIAERTVNLFREPGQEVHYGALIEHPIGGSEWIRNMADKGVNAIGITTVPQSEMDMSDRLLYNTMRMGGQSVAAGGALSKLRNVAEPESMFGKLTAPYRAADEAAATMPNRFQAAVETAKPLITDAASGAGAGGMLTASQSVFPNSPTADMIATLLGGFGGAGAATMGRAPAATARGIYERWFTDPNVPADATTGARASYKTADTAARYVQDLASNPATAAENIGSVTQAARAGGEPIPTTGIASGDIGLTAGERGARIGNPVPFQESDQAIKDAAQAKVTGLRDPYAEPRAATNYVQQDVAAQRQAAQQPVEQARGELAQQQAQNAERLKAAETQREADLAAREAAIANQRQAVGQAQQAEQDLGGQVAAARGGEVNASERVAGAVGAAKEADTAQKAGLYRDAEKLGHNTAADPQSLAADARAVSDEISPLAGQNQSLNNVLGDLKRLAPEATPKNPNPEITNITASDLMAMRPRISQARDAATRLQRGDVVERLDRINGAIKDQLDSLAASGDPAALKWQEAEANFKNDFAPKYREGVGAQLDKAERAKTPVPDTQVASRFLGGGKEAAQNLQTILHGAKTEQEGLAAARDYVLADMAKTVGADGKINPARLRTWIANREGLFQAMPNLRAEANKMLQDVVNKRQATTDLQRELQQSVAEQRTADVRMRKEINAVKADNRLSETQKAERVAELERNAAGTERAIQKSAASLLLDSDPAVAAKRVFSQRDPQMAMREIVGKLKADPEALAGWKRAVTDHLIERVTGTNTALTGGTEGPLSIAGLQKFFNGNSKALAELYTPEEMNALRRAHKMLEPMGNLSRTATVGSQTAENVTLSGEQARALEAGLLLTGHGYLGTGMIMKRIRTALGFFPNSRRAAGELVARMWFDPELAQHLLTRNVKEIQSPKWNARLTFLLGASEATRDAMKQPDQPK